MKKKNKYGKLLSHVISFILFILFTVGLLGMTYIDSKTIQEEMETKIERVARKSDQRLNAIACDELSEEEIVYQVARGMADVYEYVQEEEIGMSFSYVNQEQQVLLEEGNRMFYHIYETYEDDDKDLVYDEIEQKILCLDDYFTQEQIENLVTIYKNQGEEAEMAVEGYSCGAFLIPTKVVVLGSVKDPSDFPQGRTEYLLENGNKFFYQMDKENYYYALEEYSFEVQPKEEYQPLPENVVLECEFSFVSNYGQTGVQQTLAKSAREKMHEKGKGEQTFCWTEATKKNTTSLVDGTMVSYCFTGTPLKNAVMHLTFFYMIAVLLYVVVVIILHRLIGEVFDKQESLNQTQKMLTRAIAHELKTPLSIIQGYCEGLRIQKSEEKRQEYMDTIVEETKEMNRLVLDMLELSKLETNGYAMEVEEIELVELVYSIKRQYQSFIDENQIDFQLCGEEEMWIDGDLSGMAKVVSNLLGNAIKHAPIKGIVRITIEQTGKKKYVRFYNNGPKIEEEIRKHIWDGYYHTNEDNTKRLRSTGLGLTIVKHLLELHKFGFGCENKDVGVEFYVEIPMEEQKDWNLYGNKLFLLKRV